MQTFYLSLLPLLASALPQDPASNPPFPDACGPQVQPEPNPLTDTCQTAVTGPVSDAAPYAVKLDTTDDLTYNDPGPNNQIKSQPDWTTTCGSSIESLCSKLSSAPLGKWTWDATANTCLVGVYLPNLPGAAMYNNQGSPNHPTYDMCKNMVLSPMASIMNSTIKLGEGGNFQNRGTVNVVSLPHGAVPAWAGSTGGYGAIAGAPATDGQAVNSGYPSWLMQGGVGPSGMPVGTS